MISKPNLFLPPLLSLIYLVGCQSAPNLHTPLGETDFYWGVNGHPFSAYPGIRLHEQIDAAAELGARYYRVNLRRSTPTNRLQHLVAEGAREDVRILPILMPPLPLSDNDPETLYEASYEFAEHWARRMGTWQ